MITHIYIYILFFEGNPLVPHFWARHTAKWWCWGGLFRRFMSWWDSCRHSANLVAEGMSIRVQWRSNMKNPIGWLRSFCCMIFLLHTYLHCYIYIYTFIYTYIYIILYYTILYYIILYYTILYYIILYYLFFQQFCTCCQVGGQTIQIYRNDGTIHSGPRTDYTTFGRPLEECFVVAP